MPEHSIFFLCVVPVFILFVCAFKMLFGKGFEKENRKEIGKKRERGKPSLSAWRPGQRLAQRALGPVARPARAALPPPPLYSLTSWGRMSALPSPSSVGNRAGHGREPIEPDFSGLLAKRVSRAPI